MHKLSLHHLTMLDAHPLQLVDAAAAGGFDYCGMRIVAPTAAETIIDVAGDRHLIREVGSRLEATGVHLLDIEAIWLQPATNIAALLPALETGQVLGAGHVLAVGHDRDRSRLFDNFCRLCEAAAGFDLSVGLEPITYCTIGTLEDALSVIRQARQSNARLLIDALQFFRSGASCEQVETIGLELIEYMQICDAPLLTPASLEDRQREARTRRLLPGDGELPLHALLSRLPGDLTLAVEAPTIELRAMPFDEQARRIHARMREFLAMQ